MGASAGTSRSTSTERAERVATAGGPSAVQTYRTLRVGLVVAGLLLLVGGVVETLRAGALPGSISALFYTPARDVLVGVLLATGLTMVAIRGRRGAEDALLDVAGVLLPLVALVPTPVALATVPGSQALGLTCPDRATPCIPPELAPVVSASVVSYAVVGALAIAFAWWRVVRAARRQGWSAVQWWSTSAASLVWFGLGGWFLLGRESFDAAAHYVCAVTFFVALVAVVWLSSLRTRPERCPAGIDSRTFRRCYRAVALAMAAGVLAGLGALAVQKDPAAFPLLLVIEVWLLLCFIAFWVLQTIELWDETEPPG